MLAVATRSSSTRQDIANESCGVCGEKFGTFGRAIEGTCKHKICLSCIRQKDKERGSGGNVAKGAFLPCSLPSCDGKFEFPEVIDLLSSDEEDVVEEVGVSSPVKQEECTSTHVKREGDCEVPSLTPSSNDIVSSPAEKKIKHESISSTGNTVTPPHDTNKVHIKSEHGKDEINDTTHKEARNLKPSTNEVKVVKSEDDKKMSSIRKPLFNGGDKVYAAWWDPSLDPDKEHDHGGYFPGTIVSYKTISSNKYGPIRTYHIKYDDGDELQDIQDYWIFSKQDYDIQEDESKSLIGVENRVDNESDDKWASIVGWYEVDTGGPKVQSFSFLSEAMKAHDDHIVHTYGKQTKKSQLNNPENYPTLFDDYESDSDSSHFSQGSEIWNKKYSMKKEDIDGEDTDDDEQESSSSGTKEGEEGDGKPFIKKEYADYHKKEALEHRKYGDRVLLARQSKLGMMKLGGGNQASRLYPVDPDEREERLGGRYAMAYNILWNYGAPKFAGQPTAHVTMIPEEEGYDPPTTSFSVFAMRRHKNSTLGWEYCGEYVLFDDLKGTDRAQCVMSVCKQSIVNDIKRSLSCKNGHWHSGIASWRERILEKCSNDQSPPGPTRLIRLANDEPEPNDTGQEREDRIEKESKEKASSAAKARALGLDNTNLSDSEFAERLVHYDDFYSSYTIKFVSYDETMYKFVKRGETTKDKNNNSRKGGKPCAKAIDWYNIMDQQVVGNDENKMKKKKKKRKRSSSR